MALIQELPMEIWDIIASHLVVDPPASWVLDLFTDTWTGDYRSTGKQRPPEDYELIEECRAGQNALLALFKVSRGMASVVERSLYRSILITNGRGLASISALVKQRPYLANYVRGIYCLADLESRATETEWYFCMQESEHGKGSSGRMRKEDVIPIGDAKRQSSRKKKRNSIQRPVATISWDSTWQRPKSVSRVFRDMVSRTTINDLLCPISLLVAIERQHGMTNASAMSTQPPLQYLKHLRILGGGNTTGAILSHIVQLPQLERLEASLAAARRDYGTATETSYCLPRLKHVKFYQAQISEGDLAHFCDSCPRLETLVVQFQSSGYLRGSWRPASEDKLRPHKTLSQVLYERSDTLRHLELLSPHSGCLPVDNLEILQATPPWQRLPCLPTLTNLLHLTIDFSNILDRQAYIEVRDIELLSSLLPPSLLSLGIACDWPARLRFPRPTGLDDSAEILFALPALHRAGALPASLQRLIVALTERDAYGDKRPGAITGAKEYFATTAVEFSVKHIPYLERESNYHEWLTRPLGM